jgi:hypothetical protein
MDAANVVLSAVAFGTAVASFVLMLYQTAHTTDIVELINESDSLRRAVEAVRLHPNYDPQDQELQSLVQQGIDILSTAFLLENTSSDGTSTVVRVLPRAREWRWIEKPRTIISKMRTVNSMLIRIMEDLYVLSSSLEHASVTDSLQRAEGRPKRDGEC